MEKNMGSPTSRGAVHTSSKHLASSNQDLKLSIADSTVASEGAPSQGAHFAWSELLVKHTVDLKALGANPSNEEPPDICQGSQDERTSEKMLTPCWKGANN